MASKRQSAELVAKYTEAFDSWVIEDLEFRAIRLEVVRGLRGLGHSFREIGQLLEMSHQRAQQIGSGR
ncbi:MAG: hypothetical protein V3U34_00550 [candidate division NC10 bacterium]